MKKQKGIAINTTAELVLMIIIVVAIGAFIYFYVPGLSNWLENWMCDTVQFCIGNAARSNLENALLGSYYMCEAGCSNLPNPNLLITLQDGSQTKLVNFCNSVPDFFKNNGHLCGSNFPFEMSFSSDSINANHFSVSGVGVSCVISDESQGTGTTQTIINDLAGVLNPFTSWSAIASGILSGLSNFWTMLTTGGTTSAIFFVPSAGIDKTTTCNLYSGNQITNAVSSGTVTASDAFIFTENNVWQTFWGYGPSEGSYVTITSLARPYPILTSNVPYAIRFQINSGGTSDPYRLSVQQNGQVIDEAGIETTFNNARYIITNDGTFYCGGNTYSFHFVIATRTAITQAAFCNYRISWATSLPGDTFLITYVPFTITTPTAAGPGQSVSLTANLQSNGDIVTFNQACVLVGGACDSTKTFSISKNCTIQDGTCSISWTLPSSITSGTVQVSASDKSGLSATATFPVGTCTSPAIGGICENATSDNYYSCVNSGRQSLGQFGCSSNQFCCAP